MKTIFVGPLGGGKTPENGASVKNYHILNKIRPMIKDLMIVDTENWKKNPLVLLKLLVTILTNRGGKYILSLNNGSANKVIRILQKLAPKAEIIYWVIGGSIAKWLKEGKLAKDCYAKLSNIIVEGRSMKTDLEEIGITNVAVMPNFKKVAKIPINRKDVGVKRFVFLSRIIPEKGCNLIFEAVEILRNKGYSFAVDFWGPIDDSYSSEFNDRIKKFDNVRYKGFLDLRNLENYKILTEYDALLFPTYWPGEGCPGIVIDAYMSGLPILGSRWNLNPDYIKDCETGILFEPGNSKAMADVMEDCITGKIDLTQLSKHAYEAAGKYDIDEVLSKDNLIAYKILND